MSMFKYLAQTLKKDNYKKLKCLIATGTQYIITDYIPNANTRIEMKMNKPYWNEQWDTMFGSRSRLSFMQYGWNASNTLMQVEMFGNSQSTGINIQFNTDVEVILDCSIPLFKYGNYTYTPTLGSTMPTDSLLIFAKRKDANDNIDHRSNYKLYYFRIYENGVLVRNYMPALDDNNVPCLYDTVNKNYFYNSGTGSFDYEHESPYIVSYIQNVSNSYINTNYYPKGITNFEIKFAITGSRSYYQQFWAATANYLPKAFNNGGGLMKFETSYPSTSALEVACSQNVPYVIKIDGNNVYKDGNLLGTLTRQSGQDTTPLYIFNSAIQTGDPSYLRVYYVKIWENDELVLNLVPVSLGTMGAMMDTLSGTVYYNAGGGKFTFQY